MTSRSIKKLMLSFASLSVLTLTACGQDQAEESTEPATEVEQESVESSASYESQLSELNERIQALYEEESDGQDVNLEQFEADENLEDDLVSMQNTVKTDEDKQSLQALMKEYGLIVTMASVKSDLSQVYDIELQEVLAEEGLPVDFEMRLHSLSDEKEGFYDTYQAHYKDYQEKAGQEASNDEDHAKQARINAIRSLLIMPDGSINPNVSDADLQQLHGELVNLGANETASQVQAELNRRSSQAQESENNNEDQASNSQPSANTPSASRRQQPSTTSRPPAAQPSRPQNQPSQPSNSGGQTSTPKENNTATPPAGEGGNAESAPASSTPAHEGEAGAAN